MTSRQMAISGLALLVMLTAALTAKALMIAPPPVGLRLATAQIAVVGKVTQLADKTVPAELFKDDTQQMMIATVKVDQVILGKPGKEIKVGFVVPMDLPGRPPLGRPIFRGPMVNLVVDQEALMLLKPHPKKKDVYLAADMFSILNKNGNPNFKNELQEVQKAAKVLSNPQMALKAKNPDDQLFAAALLLSRYYTPEGEATKTEKVSVTESKLILDILANADWKAPERGPGGYALNPQGLFFRLNLTSKDGWNQPADFNRLEIEAKKWLKANSGKFQLTRYVRPSLSSGEIDPEP
ncbi:MAG: hypothetical protein SNJ82_06140 [Gemmataceae bacterium]